MAGSGNSPCAADDRDDDATALEFNAGSRFTSDLESVGRYYPRIYRQTKGLTTAAATAAAATAATLPMVATGLTAYSSISPSVCVCVRVRVRACV